MGVEIYFVNNLHVRHWLIERGTVTKLKLGFHEKQ